MTMNVSLGTELETMVRDRVASGRYSSASEVVRAALRLLDEREARERLRRLLLEGLESGPAEPADWTALRGEVRRRLVRKT